MLHTILFRHVIFNVLKQDKSLLFSGRDEVIFGLFPW